MNKPVSIAKEEFTNKIVLLINESELPPILMEPVIANCLRQIQAINEAQLKKDKEDWNKFICESVSGEDCEIISSDDEQNDA